ncbi:MAG: YaiI/YqxD family protein [Spirochaetota bacterium]
MRIVVDADSCPKNIRAIIIKAARRIKRRAIFAADRNLPDCSGEYVDMLQVEPGTDHADDAVVDEVRQGDLVITRDVLLATRVVEQGCVAIDDRGNVYTQENIAERLSLRNMMTSLREAGVYAERHKPLGKKEVQQFANALDRHITKLMLSEDD